MNVVVPRQPEHGPQLAVHQLAPDAVAPEAIGRDIGVGAVVGAVLSGAKARLDDRARVCSARQLLLDGGVHELSALVVGAGSDDDYPHLY